MRISVVIPTYNRSSLLERSVYSVSKQTYPPYELIIVDDHSDDFNYKFLCNLKLRYSHCLNITIIRNEINKGANYCRNLGINRASGDFIAFLDSDDAWLPDKLFSQVNALRKKKEKTKFYFFA